MEGLASASSFVKGELGRRLKMRRTPELVFVLDRGFERSANVLGILHQLEQKRLEKGDLVTEAAAGTDEAVKADELDDENADYDETDDEADDEGEDEADEDADEGEFEEEDEDYEGDEEDMDDEFEEEDEFDDEEEVEDGDDQADGAAAENADTKTP
jgi:hypothetical protein